MLTRRTLLASAAAAPMIARPGMGSARAGTPADVLVMAKQIDDMLSLDPAEAAQFTTNELDNNFYRKLIIREPKTGATIIGDIAKSWDISADALTLTFHLGDDAVFESGRPVTAQDAAFSFYRVVQLNKVPAYIITQLGFTPDNVEKLIRAVDEKTLTIQLPRPVAPSLVLFCLSANVAGIIDKEVALSHQSNGDLGNGWLKANSAGAGPLKLTRWAASDTVVVDANPQSGLNTGVKRIVIRHVKEPAAQLLLLQKGDVDIAWNLGADELKALANDANVGTISAPQATTLHIYCNRGHPHLSKTPVVQAIKWAIDYDAIADNITPQTYVVAQSFLPPGMPGALTERPFRKDTARARQLLAEAGLADGFSVQMHHLADPPFPGIAQVIQANLAEIGIKLQLVGAEAKQVITKFRNRQHEMALMRWGADYIDPHANAWVFCANPEDSEKPKMGILAWRNHFVDQKMTKQVEEAFAEPDQEKRMTIYADLQREMWDHGPFVILLQMNQVVAMRRGVSGPVLGPIPDYYRYAGIVKA
jgi:peptide/nickel transport system substrate-binding protein